MKRTIKNLYLLLGLPLLSDNLAGLKPCFGRGDEDYFETEKST